MFTSKFKRATLMDRPVDKTKVKRSTDAIEWRKSAAIAVFAASAFFLFCLVMLDYYQNCSMENCATVHYFLWPFHLFDFAVIFPIIDLFQLPITLRLSIPCLVLFSIFLVSFFALRIHTGALTSLIETLLFGLFIVILFESGIYFLAPDWWNIHFSNVSFFPLSIISNYDVFLGSVPTLIIVLSAMWIRRYSSSR